MKRLGACVAGVLLVVLAIACAPAEAPGPVTRIEFENATGAPMRDVVVFTRGKIVRAENVAAEPLVFEVPRKQEEGCPQRVLWFAWTSEAGARIERWTSYSAGAGLVNVEVESEQAFTMLVTGSVAATGGQGQGHEVRG